MKKYYLAYGSNLNKAQMNYRCSDAKAIGTAYLNDYELLFKGSKTGSYLTVEKKKGSKVPLGVWEVSNEDEMNLDIYEGYPNFYYKKNIKIEVTKFNGDKEKLNKVYYTYKDNLKENNTRVIKYEKGDDFNNIEDIIKSEPVFIVTNSMGDYINRIEDVNILVLFGDDASYTYKRIVYLCGCIDVKSDILPEVLLVSRDTSMDMDKSREIIREFNKRLWEKKLLR